MDTNQQIQPVNPLPPVVIALALLMIGIEAMFSLGARGIIGGPEAIGWRNIAIEDYGFNTGIFHWMIQNHSLPPEHLKRFVTYAFVHGSFTHALIGVVMLLALGKFVAEAMGQVQMLILFLLSAAFGAMVFGLFGGTTMPWLIGAYPGVYGLIGGFTCMIWLRLGQMNAPQFAAFRLIGFLMAFQLIFGMLFGGGRDWIADVAAFALGFLLSFILVPGGWARFLARMRE